MTSVISIGLLVPVFVLTLVATFLGRLGRGVGNRRFPRGGECPLLYCSVSAKCSFPNNCSRRKADRPICNAGVSMKVGIYAVRDVKADAFMQIMSFANDAVASREFGNAVRSEGSFLSKHPEDYALYRLGSVDESKGELEGQLPSMVCTAVSFTG